MHNLRTAEVETAGGLVEQKIRRNAHQAVVSGARTQEDADKELGRWLTAKHKCIERIKLSCIDSSNITVWWPTDNPHLWGFESAHRNLPYETTVDTCECEAFKHGTPCWHRVAVAVLQACIRLRFEAGLPPIIEPKPRFSSAELAAAAAELFG